MITLRLQPIPSFKNPPDHSQTDKHKQQSHPQTHTNIHIGNTIKAPAKTADQINHRVEQCDLLP